MSKGENEIHYKPIGVIRSPFKEPKGTPIQPEGAKGIDGTVTIFPEYFEGLKDVEGFSHIILIYHFHLSKGVSLRVKPFMDSEEHGVFATRAPRRPNPIGTSVVDVVDGTPVLDMKPYVPEFDIRKVERIGWLEKNIHKISKSKDDGRFT